MKYLLNIYDTANQNFRVIDGMNLSAGTVETAKKKAKEFTQGTSYESKRFKIEIESKPTGKLCRGKRITINA